jgi:hypothetical protein
VAADQIVLEVGGAFSWDPCAGQGTEPGGDAVDDFVVVNDTLHKLSSGCHPCVEVISGNGHRLPVGDGNDIVNRKGRPINDDLAHRISLIEQNKFRLGQSCTARQGIRHWLFEPSIA